MVTTFSLFLVYVTGYLNALISAKIKVIE